MCIYSLAGFIVGNLSVHSQIGSPSSVLLPATPSEKGTDFTYAHLTT